VIGIPADRPAPQRSVLAGTSSTADGQEPSMPDLWGTNPDNVFSLPDTQPDRAASDHDGHRQEIRLKDDRGRLRFPAYVWIALGSRWWRAWS